MLEALGEVAPIQPETDAGVEKSSAPGGTPPPAGVRNSIRTRCCLASPGDAGPDGLETGVSLENRELRHPLFEKAPDKVRPTRLL